ncbi:MAG: tyrosine-type recombinase/integrase [Geothrix sp.]|nr:tyrosine-type recombinase/integrase [Geothrix sp.]
MRGPNLTIQMAAEAYLDACQVNGNGRPWVYQQGVIIQDFVIFVERLGIRQICHAEVHHLFSFLASCKAAKGNGLRTLHRKGTVIRAFARWTVTSGIVKRAPIADAELRTPQQAPLDIEPFSVYLNLAENCLEPDTRDALLLLLASGLRRGELLALRWKDCDLAAGLLDVRPQRPQAHQAEGWKPKSKRHRAVGVPPWAVEILTRRLEKGGAGPFMTDAGKPIFDPSTLSHRFLRMARAKGLTMRLHDLRHAHGTEALTLGATIREVQIQLGHASVSTTERYTHVNRASPRRVAALFANARSAG